MQCCFIIFFCIKRKYQYCTIYGGKMWYFKGSRLITNMFFFLNIFLVLCVHNFIKSISNIQYMGLVCFTFSKRKVMVLSNIWSTVCGLIWRLHGKRFGIGLSTQWRLKGPVCGYLQKRSLRKIFIIMHQLFLIFTNNLLIIFI